MEGKGFEPSIEALFGKNGFFPDTISKALYWAVDKMPFTTLKDNGKKVYLFRNSIFMNIRNLNM